jgi:hypothetical protein
MHECSRLFKIVMLQNFTIRNICGRSYRQILLDIAVWSAFELTDNLCNLFVGARRKENLRDPGKKIIKSDLIIIKHHVVIITFFCEACQAVGWAWV